MISEEKQQVLEAALQQRASQVLDAAQSRLQREGKKIVTTVASELGSFLDTGFKDLMKQINSDVETS